MNYTSFRPGVVAAALSLSLAAIMAAGCKSAPEGGGATTPPPVAAPNALKAPPADLTPEQRAFIEAERRARGGGAPVTEKTAQ